MISVIVCSCVNLSCGMSGNNHPSMTLEVTDNFILKLTAGVAIH